MTAGNYTAQLLADGTATRSHAFGRAAASSSKGPSAAPLSLQQQQQEDDDDDVLMPSPLIVAGRGRWPPRLECAQQVRTAERASVCWGFVCVVCLAIGGDQACFPVRP